MVGFSQGRTFKDAGSATAERARTYAFANLAQPLTGNTICSRRIGQSRSEAAKSRCPSLRTHQTRGRWRGGRTAHADQPQRGLQQDPSRRGSCLGRHRVHTRAWPGNPKDDRTPFWDPVRSRSVAAAAKSSWRRSANRPPCPWRLNPYIPSRVLFPRGLFSRESVGKGVCRKDSAMDRQRFVLSRGAERPLGLHCPRLGPSVSSRRALFATAS